MKHAYCTLQLFAFSFALAFLLAPASAHAQACSHLGEQVTCPDGVRPGSSSSFFDGPSIVWDDGSRTPSINCCDPFSPPPPAPMPDLEPVPEPTTPTPETPTTPVTETPTTPVTETPSTPVTETPSTPMTTDQTPPPTTPSGDMPAPSGKDGVALKGPLDTEMDKEHKTFQEGNKTQTKEKSVKDSDKDIKELDKENKVSQISEVIDEDFGSTVAPYDSSASYCGPDVTHSFMAALRRIKRRMEKLPSNEKGLVDGNQFMLRGGPNANNMDFWLSYKDWGGKGECPSQKCKGKDPCYMFNGACVPKHVLSDILYGFAADQLGLPEFNAKAGGAYHENLKKRGLGAAVAGTALSVLEDATFSSAGQYRETEASIASYKFGDELSEDFDWGKALNANQINKDDWEELLKGVYTSWPWLKDCLPCPDPTPLYPYKDFSTMDWDLDGGKKQTFKEGEIEIK